MAITLEQMWAKQSLHPQEIDYARWERDKLPLQQMAGIGKSCLFVVEVLRRRYTYASPAFADLLG